MKKVIALYMCIGLLAPCFSTHTHLAKQLTELTDEDIYSLLGRNNLKEGRLTAVIDDYVDQLLTNLNGFLAEIHLDQVPLPDMHEGFTFPVPIIPITGNISLTNGNLTGINTFYRSGDVVVTYQNEVLSVHCPLGLKKVGIDYNYSAKFMGIGPKGGVEATLNNLKITFDIGFDLDAVAISLTNFAIDGSGLITVNFTGSILTDLALEILTTVVTNIIRPIILNEVEQNIQQPIQDAVTSINQAIQNFLNPNSTATF